MYLEGVYDKKESEFCLICLLSFDFKNSHSVSFDPSSERVIEKHCEDGVFYVEDLNSTNGTKINGIQIEPNVPSVLTDGDEVQFGAKILFDFKRKKVPAIKCMIKIPWKQEDLEKRQQETSSTNGE